MTADHGEQLGDHGLQQKLGWFEESHHIVGIVRDPAEPADATRGTVIDRFTENVDVFPTLCDVMGIEVPLQCDGVPLTPLVHGEEPPWWRDAAHWEYDWRDTLLGGGPARVAVGPTARATAPGRAPHGLAGLRAVRQRLVEVLRPRRRPDVAHRDHGSRPSCSRRPRRC